MKSPTNTLVNQPSPGDAVRTVDEYTLLVREVRFWDRILHKSLLFCTKNQERQVRQLIGQLHAYEARFFPDARTGNGKGGRAPEEHSPSAEMAHLELQILKQDWMEALDIMLTPRIF